MTTSSRLMVWTVLLALTLSAGGCWGRRRHRYSRTRTVESTEATSQAYEPPPVSRPPPPPPPPPQPPAPAAEQQPVASEGPSTLVSRFRSTRSNRCSNPKGSSGENYFIDGVDPSDFLNVRVEPDWRSEVVGKLPPDTRGILGLGERQRVGTSSWRKVACGAVRGWVNEKFLEREPAAR